MTGHQKFVSAKKGMLPGTAIYIGENPPQETKILTHIYNKKDYRRLEGFHSEQVKKAMSEGYNVWIDICGLENNVAINKLALDFGIHPLIIEDLLNTKQRPKLDILDDYLFIVFKLLDSQSHKHTYNSEQFSMVVKTNFMMTVRETKSYDLVTLYERLSSKTSLIRENGLDYLTYLIMDKIIDDYFNFVEETENSLEKMEDLLISNTEDLKLQDLYGIKRRTLILRKTIAPIRDIVNLLITEQEKWVHKKYHIYYHDLHDHCIRLLESVDLQREMTTSILDIYLSTLNNRMNETMKVLTIFASIFIPLTFIAGVYGMNFKYMPELDWHYSYPLLLGLMAVIATVMLFYFKRKKLF